MALQTNDRGLVGVEHLRRVWAKIVALTTRVEKLERSAKVLRIKQGIPTDADYSSTPPNGTMVLDALNNRLYVRVGGVWRFAALT